ncbi:MAG: hypothetical protein A2Z25_19435 [Planctomycetes bacterium RBG_16_55_9]|nr:MAG: hypothetical protein A2Z25_19435 [Planctomycetes bacterium RBG_16_55_9]
MPVNCPVCDSIEILPFLHRADVPVHQNMLFRRQTDAVAARRGRLELAVCCRCGFVFNQAFDQTQMAYSADYDNTQTCSPCFASYVDKLVAHLLSEARLRNKRIIEVGCGKGYFLQKLVEDERTGNTGYGFDPSYVGPEVQRDGRLIVRNCFFTSEEADTPADAIVCRHVIEHLPDPIALLELMRRPLSRTAEPLVVLETPCVEWILRNQVIWDFYYEHCSYFAADSLATAVQRVGFKPQTVRHVFGEQYLWLEATIGTSPRLQRSTPPEEIVSLCKTFAATEKTYIQKWRTKLREVARAGPVALWGGGAKGVTLANLADPDRKLFVCVVDLNRRKQGCFLPGTGHPIIDYRDLRSFQVKNVVQMNPNYATENLELLHKAGLKVTLIDPADWREIR